MKSFFPTKMQQKKDHHNFYKTLDLQFRQNLLLFSSPLGRIRTLNLMVTSCVLDHCAAVAQTMFKEISLSILRTTISNTIQAIF
jgi:hypothetical protein